MPPVTSPIAPWPRPAFQATDRSAAVTLISFADEDVPAAGVDLGLNGNVPQDVPAEALDLRGHHYADAPARVDA
jgi:hypothetical protein